MAVPSRDVTVMVRLDDPIDIWRMPRKSQAPDTFDTLVGGSHRTG